MSLPCVLICFIYLFVRCMFNAHIHPHIKNKGWFSFRNFDVKTFFRPDRYVPLFGEFFYESSKWRPSVPFVEQLRAFQELIDEGKVCMSCFSLTIAILQTCQCNEWSKMLYSYHLLIKCWGYLSFIPEGLYKIHLEVKKIQDICLPGNWTFWMKKNS